MGLPGIRAILHLRLPLALALAVPITGLLVTAVLLLSSVLGQHAERSLLVETTKRGQTVAQHVANAARTPLLTKDQLTLNLVVKEAMREADIVYIVVTDHEGTIVAHTEVGQDGRGRERATALAQTITEPVAETAMTAKNGRVLDVAIPLVFRRSTVGAVFVGLSQRSVDEALAETRSDTIAIGVGVVVAGLIVSLAVAVLLARSARSGGVRRSAEP
jgi:sensor histidine kinase regulating citrate/malate metabolism